MEEIIELVHHILDEHHKYYTCNTLDDTEMIKELKFILKGVKNYLRKGKESKKNIEKIIEDLKEYSKDKYMKTYIANFEEDSDLSYEQKKDEASYYFEYLFKHEEHPH
jgi:hypothetical protein